MLESRGFSFTHPRWPETRVEHNPKYSKKKNNENLETKISLRSTATPVLRADLQLPTLPAKQSTRTFFFGNYSLYNKYNNNSFLKNQCSDKELRTRYTLLVFSLKCNLFVVKVVIGVVLDDIGRFAVGRCCGALAICEQKTKQFTNI